MSDYYAIRCSRCGRAFAQTNVDPALMSDAPFCRGCREAAHVVKRLDEFERRDNTAQSRALEAAREALAQFGAAYRVHRDVNSGPHAQVMFTVRQLESAHEALAQIEAVKEGRDG